MPPSLEVVPQHAGTGPTLGLDGNNPLSLITEVCCGHDKAVVPRGMRRVLLERGKEKRLVPAQWLAECKAINIVAEDRLRQGIEGVEIGA